MNARRMDLHLHEQLLLLALRDDTGTLESRATMRDYAMGGAILAELMLAGRVRIADPDKKLVEAVDSTPLGEDVLDECLELVASARRRRRASHWVSRFAGIKRLRHRIAVGLCRRGVLRDDEDKVLLLFTRKVYPTIDPGPERLLRERLRLAVFGDSESLAPETAVVVALAHATGMLRICFDRKALRQRRKRLERITRGDLIGEATREAVEAAQAAAAAVAVIAASTAATTAATSG